MNSKLFAIIKREYLQQVPDEGVLDRDVPDPVARPRLHLHPGRALEDARREGPDRRRGPLRPPLRRHRRRVPRAAGRRGRGEERRREEEEKLSDAETLEKASQAQKPKITTQLDLFKVDATPETLPAVRKKLNEDVQKERIKAYIVLTPQTLETGAAEWRAQSVKAEVVMREQIASYLSRAATKERLKDRGVDPKVYDAARLRVDLEPHEAKEIESGESGKNVGHEPRDLGRLLLPHLHVDLHLRRLHHARRPRGEEQPHRGGDRLVGQADDAHAREDPRDRPRRPHAVRRLGVPRARGRAAGRRGRDRDGRGAAAHSRRDDRRVRPLLPARVLPLLLALRRAFGALQYGAGGAAVRHHPRHDAHPARPRRGSSRSTSRTARSRRCCRSSRSRRRS